MIELITNAVRWLTKLVWRRLLRVIYRFALWGHWESEESEMVEGER